MDILNLIFGTFLQKMELKVNSLLVNDEEINGSGGEMEEAVEEEIEVSISILMGNFLILLNISLRLPSKKYYFLKGKHLFRWLMWKYFYLFRSLMWPGRAAKKQVPVSLSYSGAYCVCIFERLDISCYSLLDYWEHRIIISYCSETWSNSILITIMLCVTDILRSTYNIYQQI